VQLVPIGRFSQLTRLSVKALRLYDEMKLLEPAQVDEDSGWRYYALAQANRAEAIRLLRGIDMPLEEIRGLLDATDPAAVTSRLQAYRSRVEQSLAETRRALVLLQRLIDSKEGVMPYDIKVKEVPPQDVLCIAVPTTLATIGATIGECYAEIMRYMGERGYQMAGPPYSSCPDGIDEERETTVECCMPVQPGAEPQGRIELRRVTAGPAVWTVHRGPYDQIGPAYAALFGWMEEHGHQAAGPAREIYLNDPGETAPEDLETEIDWPIR